MQAFCSNAERILGLCPNYSKTIFDNVDLPITDFKLNIHYLYDDYTKYPHKLIPVNLKCKIMPYLKKLSFSTYILAGNSMANIIENVPIVGDLDFFVHADYMSAFEEITAGLNIIKIQAQPTLIDVFTPDLRISIIHTEYVDPANLIFNFDFDYCRAYMDK